MNSVVVSIATDSGYRASEVVADLRNTAETLYFPMRLVGFWDVRAGVHLCPQEERRQSCAHETKGPEAINSYAAGLERDRKASLEVVFPHAEVRLYLA